MVELIGKISDGYRVRKAPYEGVCVWYPEHFVLECECGGLLLCDDPLSLCRCGADHSDLVRDLVDARISAGSNPWYEERSLLREKGSFSTWR